MHCPTLAELPPPPSGKSGWPWTVETPQLPEITPRGKRWPRISIVTPSYNQGQFIEETIRSVLLQGYPDLEYVIIDGGSSDESVRIIKKYEPWLKYWVSEPDRGQAHAINKGLNRVGGQIQAYVNSDDIYLAGAFQHIGQVFTEIGFDVIVGQTRWIGVRIPSFRPWRRSSWRQQWRYRLQPFTQPLIPSPSGYYQALPQHSVFWSRTQSKCMRFREQLQFVMDYEWFLRLFSGATVVHSRRPLASYRQHSATKGSTIPEVREREANLYKKIIAKIAVNTDKAFRHINQEYQVATLRALFLYPYTSNQPMLCISYPDYFQESLSTLSDEIYFENRR